MMSEVVIDALINEEIFQQADRSDLLDVFENSTITQILQEAFHDEDESGNRFQYVKNKVVQSSELRKLLFPELHFWLIRHSLKTALPIKDHASTDIWLNEKIQKFKEKSIKSLIMDVSDNRASAVQIRNAEKALKEIEWAFEELKENIGQDVYRRYEEEIKELEEDIKKISDKDSVDYKIRNIELNLKKYATETKKQPILSKVQQTILKSIPLPPSFSEMNALHLLLAGKDVLRNLKIFQKSFYKIDIYQLSRLIQEGTKIKEQNFKGFSNQIKKKVILLFGPSKAGKTTIIVRILGYLLKKILENGLPTLQPEKPEEMDQKHKKLIIEASNRSGTRNAHLVQIPTKCLPENFLKNKYSKYFMMDSSGLADSRGSQVDIANMVSLFEFVKDVDKLFIVIVINEKNWGTKGEEIIHLAQNASKLLKSKEAIQSIQFVFNNFSKQFKESLHSQVKDLYNNFKEQKLISLTDNLKAFFDTLLQQTKNPYFIDPLQMNPQKFIADIIYQDGGIENTGNCFISDIGKESRQKLESVCKKIVHEFQDNFKRKCVGGALYCIERLRMIADLKKVYPQAQRNIYQLENNTGQQVKKQIKACRKFFQEYEGSFFRQKKDRYQKLETLSKEYSALKCSTYDFMKIFPKNQGDILKPFQQLLPNVINSFKDKIKIWDQEKFDIENALRDSINAINFFQKFGTKSQTESLMKEFQQIKDKYQKYIADTIKSETKQHKLVETLKCLEALSSSEIFNKEFDTKIIHQIIRSKLTQYMKKIKIIDLSANLQQRDHEVQIWKVQDIELEKENINELLSFLQLIEGYPEKLVEFCSDAKNNMRELISFKCPNALMKKLQNIVNSCQKKDDDDDDEDIDQTDHNREELDSQMQEIHQIVKILKMLEEIEIINSRTEGRISQQFQKFQSYFQNIIWYLMKICEAFHYRDQQQIKRRIIKIKSYFKKVNLLVEIINSQTLRQKFTSIKINFSEQVTAYYKKSTFYYEKVTFRSKSSVTQLLEENNRLENILKIKNLFEKETKSNFEKNITDMIQKNEETILQPLKYLSKQIKEKKFIFQKIYEMNKFVEYIKLQLKKYFCSKTFAKLKLLEEEINGDIVELYSTVVQKPLQTLKSWLNREIMELISNESDEKKMETVFDHRTIQKYNKLLSILFELKEQTLITNYEELRENVKAAFELVQSAIESKLDMEETSSNTLDRLKKITFLFRYIETKGFECLKFEEIYQKLKEQCCKLAKQESQSLQKIIEKGSDPENFDEDYFCIICPKFLNDKSPNGLNNRKKLLEHINNFKEKTSRRIKNLHRLIQIDEDALVLKQQLEIIYKFLKVRSTIWQNDKELKVEIVNLKEYLEAAVSSFIKIFTMEFDSLMKGEENSLSMKRLLQIEFSFTQIQRYQQIQSWVQFKKEIVSLKEYKDKQIKKREELIQRMMNCSDWPTMLASQDIKMLDLLDPARKKIISERIWNYLLERINNSRLKQLYYRDYPKFKKEVSQIEHTILKANLDEQQRVQFSKICLQISMEENQKFQQLAQQPLKMLLSQAQIYENSDNSSMLYKIAENISMRPRIVKSQDLREEEDPFAIFEQLVLLRPEIFRKSGIIKTAMKTLQNRLLQRITLKIQRKSDSLNQKINEKTRWSQILKFTLLLKKYERNEHENNEKIQIVLNKLTELYISVKEKVEKLVNEFKIFVRNPLQHQNSDAFCEKINKFMQSLSQIFLFEEETDQTEVNEIRKLDVIFQENINELTKKAKQLENGGYNLDLSEQYQFDEDVEISKLEQQERSFNVYQKLKILCKKHFDCQLVKTIEDKKNEFQQKLLQIQQLFRTRLEESHKKPDSLFDKRLNYILKLFQLQSSTPSAFLQNPHYDFCLSVLLTKINNSQEKIKEILQKNPDPLNILKQLVFLEKMKNIQQVRKDIEEFLNSQFQVFEENNRLWKQLKNNLLKYKKNPMCETLYGQYYGGSEKNYPSIAMIEDQQTKVLTQMLNKKVISQEQMNILDKMLKKFYKEVSNQQESYLHSKNYSSLISCIKDDGEQFKKMLFSENPKKVNIEERVVLLAKICSLCCIYYSEKRNKNQPSIIKPNISQVICALLMICCDGDNASNMLSQNRLCRVKPGQGKSLILVVIAIYLALLGYEVHIGCYSKLQVLIHESQFMELLELCGTSKKIIFGDMKQNIRKLLTQKNESHHRDYNFGEVVSEMLAYKKQKFVNLKKLLFSGFQSFLSKENPQNTMRVLLVDELESLFNPDFYSGIFTCQFIIKGQSFENLMQFIWQKQNDPNLSYEMIHQSNQFKEFIEEDSNVQMRHILQNQIHGMLQALKTYQSQQYEIHGQRIYYRPSGNFLADHCGYNTIYAYLEAYKQGKVSYTNKHENMFISLKSANFSYACLAKHYDNILVVTGDISTLCNFKRSELYEKYKISQRQVFKIPRTYPNNGKILPTIQTEKVKYKQVLASNITQEHKKNRPVLVLFKNALQLNQFYNSVQFKDLKGKSQTIKGVNSKEKCKEAMNLIAKASDSYTITLLSSQYIRGVAPKISREKAEQNGGFHLIIAYYIQSPQDYMQALSRVKRHGQKYTYIEIYCKQELAYLGIQSNSCNQNLIEKKKAQKLEQNQNNLKEKLKHSEKIHNETMNLYTDRQLSQQSIVKFIYDQNQHKKYMKTFKKFRMMLLIDADANMTPLLQKLKLKLPETLTQSNKILLQNNIEMEIQIVLIRNYFSHQILEYSIFDNHGRDLQKFLQNKEVTHNFDGAVEVGLHYANTQKLLNEIILMTGSRIESLDKIKEKRKKYPQKERKRIENGINESCCGDEVLKLKQNSVKLHTFYPQEKSHLKQPYSTLSGQTYGETHGIDPQETEALLDFIISRAKSIRPSQIQNI